MTAVVPSSPVLVAIDIGATVNEGGWKGEVFRRRAERAQVAERPPRESSDSCEAPLFWTINGHKVWRFVLWFGARRGRAATWRASRGSGRSGHGRGVHVGRSGFENGTGGLVGDAGGGGRE